MKAKLLFCAWLCLINSIVIAQNQEIQQKKYFSFTYDNDFFNATDYYYTQGIRLELGAPVVKKSPISKLLLPFKKDAFQQYAITLAQDCFTPPGISRDTIQTSQRPYAGLLYLSHVLTATQPRHYQQLITQLHIGVIGHCAQCKEMQTGIHRLLDNIPPKGWKFQLANDLVLNYSIQFNKGLLLSKYLELLGFTNARAGTLYDDLAVGSSVRLGFFEPYFESPRAINKHPFYLHGLINGNIRAVAYNATLQGGLFNPNDIYTLSSNRIKRIVASGAIGIMMTHHNVSLEFIRVFMSPDFKNGLSHGWGHINIKANF